MTIVITLPTFIENESHTIMQLFEQRGIDRLHIRKPDASAADVERLLQAIPAQYYDRISIHDHHALAQQYNLTGIHLTGRHPEAPVGWTGLLSTSCHSIDELAHRQLDKRFAYLSLSPIFDSISKQGYNAAFSLQQLAEAREQGIINHRVLALGGVSFARLPEVMQMGFGGGMILGDAWKQL